MPRCSSWASSSHTANPAAPRSDVTRRTMAHPLMMVTEVLAVHEMCDACGVGPASPIPPAASAGGERSHRQEPSRAFARHVASVPICEQAVEHGTRSAGLAPAPPTVDVLGAARRPRGDAIRSRQKRAGGAPTGEVLPGGREDKRRPSRAAGAPAFAAAARAGVRGSPWTCADGVTVPSNTAGMTGRRSPHGEASRDAGETPRDEVNTPDTCSRGTRVQRTCRTIPPASSSAPRGRGRRARRHSPVSGRARPQTF